MEHSKLKFKKQHAGSYKAEGMFNGVKYIIESDLMDDYKSFMYKIIAVDGYGPGEDKFFADGYYGMRLKEIKTLTLEDCERLINQEC